MAKDKIQDLRHHLFETIEMLKDKDFVPYEMALELKQIGFNERCYKYVFTWGEDDNAHDEHEFLPSQCERFNDNSFCISQPTYSQAFRWFREEYDLVAIVSQFGHGIEDKFGNISDFQRFYTYDENEVACMKKLIKIVKGGKK
jgi:hypothetical protein